ncbi:hypothetical protein [Sulfurisphaera ohwakuensis]|uniref:DNA repair exonuclease SbcCD ATPase subunit n=1 Tax=Sulfurisphaera ohwakuensis TaxID=69656 RepID=A0A650CJ23_SULOH|nr:hypothetical protein [Sulfurisphaera ohwakuensis]MBB5253513.1 DNA repair exonuclease SbcCD ATPase subunit [Sulfurisphaera ohwakuensis]QGR17820.1 hypothetical protein D1869_12005 [Sulfurisphaera ohwakuensis]
MQKAKSKKKERYIDRWLKGKKRMSIIMREEEYNIIKQFCDSNRISYREFFVSIAPRLLKENEELKKTMAEKDSQINDLTAKYNSLVEKYNTLVEKYKQLKGEYEDTTRDYENLLNEYNKLKGELSRVSNELEETKQRLREKENSLNALTGELTKLKEILDILTHGRVEVPVEYCEKLKPYGFHLATKEVSTGFMKKSYVEICTNE